MNEINLNLDLYKNRIVEKQIDEYMSTFGAICIEGPKWCGKTWTATFKSKEQFFLLDPSNNFSNKKLAEISPTSILLRDKPLLVDEWQEVPSIWDTIKFEVDKNNTKGQFILTGSSTPKDKGIFHSGIGRIAKIRMNTMSLFERGKSTGSISLFDVCNGKLDNKNTGEITLNEIINLILEGGFPGSLNAFDKKHLIPKNYLENLLDDDLRRYFKKSYSKVKMHSLLLSLARNESTTSSLNKIVDDLTREGDRPVNYDTCTNYLEGLQRLFVIDDQEPMSLEIRSRLRLKKQVKHHFFDVSIVCSLLNLTSEELLKNLDTLGFLFESLCEHDLKIYAQSFGANLYHYQDYNNNEIDATIKLSNGDWCAFEIKLGTNQVDQAAKNLIKIKQTIENNGMKPPKVMCVICGLSNMAYLRDDGVYVLPITALKN